MVYLKGDPRKPPGSSEVKLERRSSTQSANSRQCCGHLGLGAAWDHWGTVLSSHCRGVLP